MDNLTVHYINVCQRIADLEASCVMSQYELQLWSDLLEERDLIESAVLQN